MSKHYLPGEWRRKEIAIDLVGCGGSGSRLLTELAQLHVALRQLGHPHGLHVTAWDPDRITEANIGRTTFAPSDIGQSKAAVLGTRLNAFYGLHWHGIPRVYQHPYWHMQRAGEPPDLLITAVDSLRARAELHHALLMGERRPPRYWMDLGNDADTGQVVLGEPEWIADPGRKRLRTVVDLFPDMLERAESEAPEPESCTLAAALDRQALYINRHVSTWAAELLWRLFRDGGLEWHGVFVNARTGRVNPIAVGTADPAEAERRLAELLAGSGAELAEVRG